MKAKLLTTAALLIAVAAFAAPRQDLRENQWQPERDDGRPFMQQRMQHNSRQMQQPRPQQAPRFNPPARTQQYRRQASRPYYQNQPRQYYQRQAPVREFKKQRFLDVVKKRAMQNPEFRKKLRQKLMSKEWQADRPDRKCLKEEGKCPQNKKWDEKGQKQQGRFEGKQNFQPRKGRQMAPDKGYHPKQQCDRAQGQKNLRDKQGRFGKESAHFMPKQGDFRQERRFAPRQGGFDNRRQNAMSHREKNYPEAKRAPGKMIDKPMKFRCPHCGEVVTKEMIVKNRLEAQKQGRRQYDKDSPRSEMRRQRQNKEHQMNDAGCNQKDECDDKGEQEKRRQGRNKHKEKH